MSEPTVNLSLTVKDGNKALDFYANAFGATELYRMPTPAGGVAHAEFQIGSSKIYLSDESEDWHAYAMPAGAKASCLFSIAVENCDEACAKALGAGAEVLNEPADMFWGARYAMVKDPFGYRWALTQIVEELSPEEMDRRAKEAVGFA
ncbi:VOC family protein [Pelagicoccus sp. NFK12]|uniref:VOC family protein n=1 Tax=Pelagicoccus enzymogenes TaxID=2773457 RepID=A0A927F989_9BACT|nr:VOC family protein [Pelagicoccus enzymogenes]MBD5780184.1 VOC family protein [Pelagicoccus enzymogenes]